ncbi:hypothetical protein IKN40_02945 [bacterium]|nr:hypothetical protein [bacterium]
MIYLVCIFAILAIIVAGILIDMGISEPDKLTIGIGVCILGVVLTIGGFFYAGVYTPLVIFSLLIGLLMCCGACKGMASCPTDSPYPIEDKLIGSAYWGFSMVFIAIGFYYWYYIPETQLLTIAMAIVATVAFAYAMYCLFAGKSNFLPGITALVFAGLLFYFGEVRGILTLHWSIYYLVLAIIALVGMRFLIGIVHGINILHEPKLK